MIEEIFKTDYAIFLSALLLILGIVVSKFSTRIGVPSLVLFILVGMLAGSDGLGLIYFDNERIAQAFGIFALIIILFEGGLHTNWSTIQKVAVPSLSMATVGVLFTTVIFGVATKFILQIGWFEAFLIGSIVGSTDAAAVFAVLRGQNIKKKLSATLEAESGTNDPMAVFLTLTLIELISVGFHGFFSLISSFIWQMGIGLVFGAVFGKVALLMMNRINLDSGGLYPIFALGFALLTYSISAILHASGLLAVYVAALIIGNADLTYHRSILRFMEGFAGMMQIAMFVLLGLLVFPSRLFQFDLIIHGLWLSLILIFIARPVAIFLSTAPFSFRLNERIFLSWAGLRGAVPIVLATYPILAELQNSQIYFNIVFFIVLTSTLIQGSTISLFAQRLKLFGPQQSQPQYALELHSIGKANAEMIEADVNENMFIEGKTLKEIDFPQDILINAIIRDQEIVTPYGETVIKSGDTLYILTSKKSKKALKRILNREKVPDRSDEILLQ